MTIKPDRPAESSGAHHPGRLDEEAPAILQQPPDGHPPILLHHNRIKLTKSSTKSLHHLIYSQLNSCLSFKPILKFINSNIIRVKSDFE